MSGNEIEKIYQKKSQLEHILIRPDTYIGSVERTTELMWVYDNDNEVMVQKEITYVPGLYKIFDEILVNAADNKQRDPNMDAIRIHINQEQNTISVYNNGRGIPVVIHKEENMYIPTLIFGHLLTSSNFDDEEEKVTGGRNGYGAKLCNIFSTKFTIETVSTEYKKHFKQTWKSNMTKASEPSVTDSGKNYDFTKVTFTPDLAKFKMDKLEEGIVALMSRRAYDIAASCHGVKVFLNGEKLKISKFKDYVDLYIKGKKDENGSPLKVVYEKISDRWEIAITLSERGFQQVSFVNSIATTKGGKHVDMVSDNIVKIVLEVLKKKNKGGILIKPFEVKNHIWIFVNCLVVNPTFDSQTKENMTLQAKSFGSKCIFSEKFISVLMKCGLVEAVLTWAKFKAQNELVKTSGKKQIKLKGIPKLEDANDAGTKNAHLCTLILTEGDSAKTLAVSGLSVVGRDRYGVFPLKGKPLNVRDASHKQILENSEINNLIKIIGLQYKKKYNTVDDLKSLRYGKVMIMADQDHDGSHIKGLIINFVHHNWPELLKLPFLEEFITPIVKATRKDKEISFYSLPEFEEWKRANENHNTYNIKYYKGLGTSTSKEAKEYFQNMERHRIIFEHSGDMDDHHIELAFSKKGADERKKWLTEHMDEVKRRNVMGLPERYLYTKETKSISYADFVNLELVLFSNGDNIRSIPSMVDGLKPGQRKVIFTCIKRNDKREVKVAQLAGSVAEHSAYHHGEQSLSMTIVNLAQNYVGSNNINLLEPRGQFGTRLNGGKDSASPRYIFTMMSPLARMIFHPHDDPLLVHEFEDNQKIEPMHYLPILPMVLVNGAEGIGTGWATKIPNYNPRDIVQNIRRMLDDERPQPMHPWYKNFRGTIEACGDKYVIFGEAAILPDDRIEITELPVGVWTQNYKENVLEPLLGTDKVKAVISEYREYNTDSTVRFVVSLLPGKLAEVEAEGIHKVFKLQTTISVKCMNAFDHNNCLKKYEKVEEILEDFYALRLQYYVQRKWYLEGQLQSEVNKLSNQARFILEKCDKGLVVENKKRKDIVDELVKRGYKPDPIAAWKERAAKVQGLSTVDEAGSEHKCGTEEERIEDSEKTFENSKDVQAFNYLLGMSMWVLTKEKKKELIKQRDAKIAELNVLKRKTPKDLWRQDLDEFLAKLDLLEEQERKENSDLYLKAQIALAKGKGWGKGKSSRRSLVDVSPSNEGRRVQPVIFRDQLKRLLNEIDGPALSTAATAAAATIDLDATSTSAAANLDLDAPSTSAAANLALDAPNTSAVANLDLDAPSTSAAVNLALDAPNPYSFLFKNSTPRRESTSVEWVDRSAKKAKSKATFALIPKVVLVSPAAAAVSAAADKVDERQGESEPVDRVTARRGRGNARAKRAAATTAAAKKIVSAIEIEDVQKPERSPRRVRVCFQRAMIAIECDAVRPVRRARINAKRAIPAVARAKIATESESEAVKPLRTARANTTRAAPAKMATESESEAVKPLRTARANTTRAAPAKMATDSESEAAERAELRTARANTTRTAPAKIATESESEAVKPLRTARANTTRAAPAKIGTESKSEAAERAVKPLRTARANTTRAAPTKMTTESESEAVKPLRTARANTTRAAPTKMTTESESEAVKPLRTARANTTRAAPTKMATESKSEAAERAVKPLRTARDNTTRAAHSKMATESESEAAECAVKPLRRARTHTTRTAPAGKTAKKRAAESDESPLVSRARTKAPKLKCSDSE